VSDEHRAGRAHAIGQRFTDERGYGVGECGQVVERARPASAGLADPPIVDGRDDVARLGQADALRPGVCPVELRLPETTVDHDDERAWPVVGRKPKICDVVREVAIAQRQVWCRRPTGQHVAGISH